jgi:hypothetical protein
VGTVWSRKQSAVLETVPRVLRLFAPFLTLLNSLNPGVFIRVRIDDESLQKCKPESMSNETRGFQLDFLILRSGRRIAAGAYTASFAEIRPILCAMNARLWFAVSRAAELRQTSTGKGTHARRFERLMPALRSSEAAPRLLESLAFTCERCGHVAKVADDPNIDRLFG